MTDFLVRIADSAKSAEPLLGTGAFTADAFLLGDDDGIGADAVAVRCTAFADAVPAGTEALIVVILRAAPPGLRCFDGHATNAALWAFTQQAALAWAPRRIRVNAIGLGASPAGPFEAQEQAGRAAAAIPAVAAAADDIVRTIRAMAAWPSMTGQIIRLGV